MCRDWVAYLHVENVCTYTIVIAIFTHTCRGEPLTIQKGNVCATSWMDKKVVTMMSTGIQPTTGTVLRHQKDDSRILVQSIIEYNSFMGGVDRGDQIRGILPTRPSLSFDCSCRKNLSESTEADADWDVVWE